MKLQQSYYDKLWVELSNRSKQHDIGWTYEKGRIDATLLKLVKDLLSDLTCILEIGVGKGDLAAKLSYQIEHTVISYLGIDISGEGIRIAQQNVDSRFQFLVASGTLLPFKSQQFDIVICSEVIEHIIEKEKLFTEISRVLRSRGTLLMTTPNPESLTYLLPRLINKMYTVRWSSNQPVNELIEREELEKLLQEHGFEILSHAGLVFRPYTVGVLEGFLKRSVTLVRWFSEFLERKNLLPGLGLYQVIVARKKL